MDISATSNPTIYDAAAAFWFINSLVVIVADSALTQDSIAIYRQVAPSGFATPYHRHEAYGEGFYVLDGEVTFVCDGRSTVLGKHGFIFLPGRQPHGFRISGPGAATMIIVSPPASTFGDLVREIGEPATFRDLPVPSKQDFARLAAVSAKYGSTILGPLPG